MKTEQAQEIINAFVSKEVERTMIITTQPKLREHLFQIQLMLAKTGNEIHNVKGLTEVDQQAYQQEILMLIDHLIDVYDELDEE